MTSAQNLRELPNSRNHNCFGCSPVNPSGLQMRFFTDGRAVYSRVKVPEHLCGWSNIVHGGVLTTILDEVMSWSAIPLLKRIALTKGIAVEFIKPVQVGGELQAEGRVRIRKERRRHRGGPLRRERRAVCPRKRHLQGVLPGGRPAPRHRG